MIVFGTTRLTLTRGVGEFYCPGCRQQCAYRHRTMRRFFTVYFVPLIPLDVLAEFVECVNCRGSYSVDVVGLTARDYEQLRAEVFYDDVRRIMVLVMLADDEVDDAELACLREYYQRLSGRPLGEQLLASELRAARAARTSTLEYAARIGDQLSTEQKQVLVEAAFVMATATGALKPPQQEQLRQLPEVLEMSDEEFRGAVERAVES